MSLLSWYDKVNYREDDVCEFISIIQSEFNGT